MPFRESAGSLKGMTMRHSILALLGATALSVVAAQVATAADMPTKAPASAPIAMYNWTGFYIGGEAGGGWDTNNVTNVTGGKNFPAGMVHSSQTGSGFLGGAYGGFNYQINQFVIGIDGDYSWASLSGSNSTISPTGFTDRENDTVKWLATVTGRLGYAVNNWLFFGKGGWAAAGFSGTTADFNVAGVNTSNGTTSSTRNGWTLGAGVEWGITRNWSAKLEYDYVNFGTANYTENDVDIGVGGGSPAGTLTPFSRSATSYLNIVKLGVAYRF